MLASKLIPLTSMASLEFIVMAGQDRDCPRPTGAQTSSLSGRCRFSRILPYVHRIVYAQAVPSDLRAVAQTARPRGRTIGRIDSRMRAL